MCSVYEIFFFKIVNEFVWKLQESGVWDVWWNIRSYMLAFIENK